MTEFFRKRGFFNGPALNTGNHEWHNKICIGCGKTEKTQVPILHVNGSIIRPNTTEPYYSNGGPLTEPGSKIGCFFGNHKYYYDYELDRKDV